MNELRRVLFSLREFEFDPELNEEERREQENETREREGFFHQLVQVEEQSPLSGNFIMVTKALVEDADTGRLYQIDTNLMRFAH